MYDLFMFYYKLEYYSKLSDIFFLGKKSPALQCLGCAWNEL